MSVKQVMRPRGDQGPVAVQGPADSRPQPSLGDQFGAARRVAKDEAPFVQRDRLADGYAPVIEAVAAATGKPSRAYWTDNWLRLDPLHPHDYGKVWGDIARLPAAVRQRLGVPATRAEFEQQVLRRGEGRSSDQATLARGSGLASGASQFAGGVVGTLQDPANAALLPVGGGGKTIAMRVLSEAAIGSGTTVLQLPGMAEARLALGETLTNAEAGAAVVLAGVASGTLRVAGEGVAAGVRRFVPPEYKMAQALKRAVPPELRTPEQQAAIHVIERGAEIDGSSPYARTYAGLDAHAARIEATIADFHEPPGAGFVPKPADAVQPREPGRAPAGKLDREAALDFIVDRLEGGAAVTRDSGGVTKYGISQNAHPGINVAALTREGAMAIYRREYYEPLGLDRYPPDVAMVALDAAVNHGPGFARKLLADGGDVGAMLAKRRAEYARLIASDPAKYGEYAKGWENRLKRLEGELGLAPGERGSAFEGIDQGDEAAVVRPGALNTVRPEAPEIPPLRPDVAEESAVLGVRGLLSDRSVSLNDLPALASALDVGEDQVRRALERLAGQGEISVTAGGTYRRRGARNTGPEDALRFVARTGGISYDGLRESSRGLVDGPRGHDLRNTGSLAAFIPGAGPLLRPTGRDLDSVGEALWDAGYFGPPETTPRPTDTDVISFLDDAIANKRKVFSFFDTAPDAKAKASDADFEPPPEPARAAGDGITRGQWDAAAERAGIVPLLPDEIAAVQRIMAEGSDVLPPFGEAAFPSPERLAPYLLEMVNREIDDVLEASYLEVEDARYDTFLADFADDQSGQAGGGQGGRGGSAADRGDAAAGGARGDPGRGAQAQELTPAERDAAEAAGELPPTPFDEATLKAFDDPAGDGAAKAADDAWHDIRAQQVDPNKAALERKKAELGAAGPLRGKVEQDGTGGLGLFAAADEPTFDLGDGQGPRKLAEIEAELDADKAAIETIEACLK